jgi:hypothetical protein
MDLNCAIKEFEFLRLQGDRARAKAYTGKGQAEYSSVHRSPGSLGGYSENIGRLAGKLECE